MHLSQTRPKGRNYAQEMKPEKVVFTSTNLREIRRKRRISQQELADQVNASRTWIVQLETNPEKEGSVTVGLLQSIGEVLRVTWELPPKMRDVAKKEKQP